MQNNVLNLKRLLLLIKLDLLANYRKILTFIFSISSTLFLYFLVSPVKNDDPSFHATLYIFLLFLGGFWTTSLAFQDLHDEKRSYIFITLPSSNFEKFISKLFLTSIGYVIAISLGYFLLSLITVGLSNLLFNYAQPIFNPFDKSILLYTREYLVWQSMFLLASVYFRKHALGKIILTVSCLIIAMIFFTFIFSLIFLGPRAFFHIGWEDSMFPHIITTLFWLGLAPFCWVVTYLRLTEAELN